MAWGLEVFAYYDPFYWGPQNLILNFLIWTLFAYFSARGTSEKPFEDAMQLMGYVFGLGLLMDFMMIPSMWVGIGMILSYVHATKYVLMWYWRQTIFILTTISISLGISALVSEPVQSIFLWGIVLTLFLILSQARLRSKRIPIEEKSEEKKKE